MRMLLFVVLAMTLAPALAQAPVRLIAEAEDFTPVKTGWQVLPYRENYFASTFAITFLSRMACLSAPEQVPGEAVAEQQVTIPAAGDYYAIARYEQPFNFSVEFTLEVVQNRRVAFRQTYGRLEDEKIWPLNGHRRVAMERFWWGGTDNIVCQQFGPAALQAGPATLRLIAGPQRDGNAPRVNAAKRNVDVIILTNDTAGMEAQKKTRYLEFDGWLTQAGDLYVRFTNPADGDPVAPSITFFNQGQHSPYYVHIRDWPSAITVLNTGYVAHGAKAGVPLAYQLAGPRIDAVKPALLAPARNPADYLAPSNPNKPESAKVFKVPEAELLAPGAASGWVPMGEVLDTLNNSKWILTVKKPLQVEFATPDGKGGLQTVKTLTVPAGATVFEMPGCVAPNAALRKLLPPERQPAIRTVAESLDWLVAEVKKFPAKGAAPNRFLIYNLGGFGQTLNHAAGRELVKLLGDNTMADQQGNKRGIFCHYRGGLDEASIEKIKNLDDLYIVSYGDEIHLPSMPPTPEEFADWLQARGVRVEGAPAYTKDRTDPLYYYAQLCAKEKGAKHFAAGTAVFTKHGVRTGTNYSPHSNYLVTEMDYIRPFKLRAITMPWSEDYVWQIPEFSIQVTGYLVSAFRAGAKYHHDPIQMYICPHSPGETPANLRRSFYTAVAHGTKVVNYFCASPLATGNTENYITTEDLPMWRAIYDCNREAGLFEDYVMDGQVRPAKVGLLLSSVDDIMTGASNSTFAMHNNERKALYYALRHSQVPVDFLSEDDLIDGMAKEYQVIYVCQQWLHSKAVAALTRWVENGGTVVAFCGGGFLNEFNQPNPQTGALFGVKEQRLITDPKLVKEYLLVENKPFLTKQDLPRYVPFDTVTWGTGRRELKDLGVIVWKQALTPADGTVTARFADGTAAAVEKAHGKGKAVLIGFLPGQNYLKSGLPYRPVDRGSSDDAFTHFIPTTMDPEIRRALVDDVLPAGFARPVECSETLVESTCIDSKDKLAVTLINYSGTPVPALTVRVRGLQAAKAVRTATGRTLAPRFDADGMTVTLPLDLADMVLVDR